MKTFTIEVYARNAEEEREVGGSLSVGFGHRQLAFILKHLFVQQKRRYHILSLQKCSLTSCMQDPVLLADSPRSGGKYAVSEFSIATEFEDSRDQKRRNMRRSNLKKYGCIACFVVQCFLLVGLATGFFSRYPKCEGVCANISGTEELMRQKEHGTCVGAVPESIRWGCDRDTADRISCYNRHYAEHSGYFQSTSFVNYAKAAGEKNEQIIFYDSVTSKKLFVAPVGRSMDDFLIESENHGWPSFRDPEVVQSTVRVLPNGETVSADGTHLGHNLPDTKGNRYCINLVSVAGQAPTPKTELDRVNDEARAVL